MIPCSFSFVLFFSQSPVGSLGFLGALAGFGSFGGFSLHLFVLFSFFGWGKSLGSWGGSWVLWGSGLVCFWEFWRRRGAQRARLPKKCFWGLLGGSVGGLGGRAWRVTLGQGGAPGAQPWGRAAPGAQPWGREARLARNLGARVRLARNLGAGGRAWRATLGQGSAPGAQPWGKT